MNRTEWLLSKFPKPEDSSDFYEFYDEYCLERGHISNETYRRYCRDAVVAFRGKAIDTTAATATVEKQKDGSVAFKLKSYAFQTEEDLMSASKLDAKKWKCDRFKVKATQNEKNPYLITEGVFEKKEKDLTFPIIHSVDIILPRVKETVRTKTQCAVVLSDMHAPLHDEKALEVSLQIIKDLYPKVIVINGDSLDLTDWSNKFLASIECRNQTQAGINAVATFIGKLRSLCPNSRIVVMEGNHGARMNKAILQNVAAASGLKRADDLLGYDALSLPNLLCLDKMDVEWQPYPKGELWLSDNLRLHHGEGLNMAKITNENLHCEVMGHGHRIEIVSRSKKVRGGQKEIYTAMFGCLCKVSVAVPSVNSFSNWQQGLGVVYYTEQFSQPVPIYIHEGTALFNGKMYTS